MFPFPAWAVVALLLTLPLTLPAAVPSVVINEFLYHPPDDRDELQWVELHNPSSQPVDLARWTFSKGIQFRFPEGTRIDPDGYLVLARDRNAFVAHYGPDLPVIGDFSGRLSHSGENLELSDADGRVVDAIRYRDAEPWPVSPDGLSASLERITVHASANLPENWAPSPLPPFRRAAGTPGQPNASRAPNLPPVVSEVAFAPPNPDQPTVVRARAADPDGLRDVRLAYRVLDASLTFRRDAPADALTVEWTELPMTPIEGDDRSGTFEATLPPQPDSRLIRFRIVATDTTGSTRLHPHPHDARPTFSVFVGRNTHTAQIPVAHLLEFGPPERPGPSLRNPPRSRRRGATEPDEVGEPSRGDATLILMPPKGRPIELFDHIRVTPRQGGWKVRLHKDHLWDGISTVNVLFEHHPRYLLSEHLGYELFRAAGVPAPKSGHWRLWHNGQPRGYHLTVEQPNSSFLRRHGRDPDGDLFKILWYGRDVVSQHEKKNNPHTGHTHLLETLDALGRTPGAPAWDDLQRRFRTDTFASYYAVNMCLQNWDGFFNNHFLYRSPGQDGQWEIIPWDLDKTWGDYDGASPKYDWYDMPLTLGMAGDTPPRSLARFFGGGGPFGGTAWWRPPGWFSGPLLAQPEFRQLFLRRVAELCDTIFTPDRLEVPITRLERRLEPEVRFRASLFHPGSEDHEVAVFRDHIDSFRRQALHRREYLLKALRRDR